MGVREKLNALKGITEEQQEYGTEVLHGLGILYDDGTIEGVNDNIPRLVARIDDTQTSSEYVWSSQKTQLELTNVAANASSALSTAISGEVSARNSAITSAVSAEASARNSAIAAAISSTYKPAGSKTVSELISSLLIENNLGNVYNITDSGETTADFVEGAGKPIRAGDNVGIVDVGTSETPSYKFDLLAGMIDTSAFVQTIKINGTTQTKTNGVVDLPAYPATLPASDTTSSYSSSGTAPVNGTAVAAALETLDVPETGGSGKYIQAISETDGKISATIADMPTSFPASNVTSSYSSTGLDPVNGTAVAAALGTLDVSAAGGSGKYIQSISETDGKISATEANMPTSLPASDVYPWAKAASKPSYTYSEVGAAASSHNQASNTINAMTGYSKPASTSAISASDTLNAAIGKLEKGLDSVGGLHFTKIYEGTIPAAYSNDYKLSKVPSTMLITVEQYFSNYGGRNESYVYFAYNPTINFPIAPILTNELAVVIDSSLQLKVLSSSYSSLIFKFYEVT